MTRTPIVGFGHGSARALGSLSKAVWLLPECTGCWRRLKTFGTPTGSTLFSRRTAAIGQKWLGHANISTTAIYTNVLGHEEMGIAARMWRSYRVPEDALSQKVVWTYPRNRRIMAHRICWGPPMRRDRIFLLILSAALLLFGFTGAARALCTLPFQITNGQIADATPVMADFNGLVNCLNSAAAGPANAIQFNAGSGVLGGIGPLADGQLVIGATSGAPQAAALTAGAGITITNGPGRITIAGTEGNGGLFAPVLSPPPTAETAGFTNPFNAGASGLTFTDVAQYGFGVIGTAVSSDGDVLRGMYMTAPYSGGVYTITALLSASNPGPSGIGLYSQANSKAVLLGAEATYWRLSHWSLNYAGEENYGAPLYAGLWWVRMSYDGTNVSFEVSANKVVWHKLVSQPITSYYSADQAAVPFLGFDNGGGITCLSFEIVNSVLP